MITKKQELPCPLCDSTNYHALYEPIVQENDPLKLYGAASGLPGVQRLVVCDNCGLIYENPRFTEDVIVQAYKSSKEAGHDSQHAMRVASFHWALKRHARFLPPKGARVLDVGTAGGAYLDAAVRFGYDAFGLEPSLDLVQRGKKRGLQIEQGTINNHGFEPESFDMVSFWDVIEHIPNPRAALRETKKLLKPNGILLLNYPDIGTWQAKLAGRRFWWILSVHLQHFTPKTIATLCRVSGFEPFHFQRYWQLLQFGYLEHMAIHYKMPLAAILTKLTPDFIQRIPIPYYASQTTMLARITK